MLRGHKLVVAIAAAVALTGGSAIASSRWIITSRDQIKPSVLAHLRGPRGQSGPRGPRGSQGSQGSQGPQGAAGVTTIQYVKATAVAFCGDPSQECSIANSTAQCPAGTFVVGGSAGVDTPDTDVATFVVPPTGGEASGYMALSNNQGTSSGSLAVTAICASGPGLTIASVRKAQAATVVARELTDLARLRRLVRARAAAVRHSR